MIPGNQQGYPGQQTLFTNNTDGQNHRFMVEQILARSNHVALVQVKAVTNKGEVKEVGSVDVQPMVKMTDGDGNAFDHGTINGLAYFRYQGGHKAVILDPKVGDIGVAVFADRDISNVKKTKKVSTQGSWRRNDFADGIFFPCVLGGKPTCYVQFTDDDHVIVSPDNGTTIVEVEAGKIKLKVKQTAVYVRDKRIDLGKLGALHAVSTVDGPSQRVFAVIDEDDA